MALEHWNDFHGWCLVRGIKPLKLAADEFQDIVLYWLQDGLSEKGLMDLERQLTIPPALHKVDKNDPVWSAKAEMDIFRKAAKR